jgi:hypothetical protein
VGLQRNHASIVPVFDALFITKANVSLGWRNALRKRRNESGTSLGRVCTPGTHAQISFVILNKITSLYHNGELFRDGEDFQGQSK